MYIVDICKKQHRFIACLKFNNGSKLQVINN